VAMPQCCWSILILWLLCLKIKGGQHQGCRCFADSIPLCGFVRQTWHRQLLISFHIVSLNNQRLASEPRERSCGS